MDNEWTRTVERQQKEIKALRRELLQAAIDGGKGKPGKGIVNAILITSILWLSMFGAYWLVSRETTIAAVQPHPLTMVEKAVCESVKPEHDSTLVTTEAGAYWTMQGGQKKFCMRRTP